ncbi:HlyD family secretion protein [Caballeronia sp. LZ043]|uniref:HlyD family secretion protein n=1 Tax=Caballeronia sp. LZ043 TaxID=3038569 RepID=UPI0028587E23|nr:HlyD family secretion protein [Caballeronia sp. LZ043]MDR5826205.1 HlyD family secretion protein [Caballeronia sp. LZ043]
MSKFSKFARSTLTLLSILVAGFFVLGLWNAYEVAPWTRDGRVSAETVRIAPEVSGTIVDVLVADNQTVRKGELLYRIDPIRYQLAVEQARALVAADAQTLRLRMDEAKRRVGLDDIVPGEEIEKTGRAVAIAQAELQKSQALLNTARLNLDRSVLRAPVNGYVTRLRLRPGDYSEAGKPNISIVDEQSFWVTGYFEETKIQRIRLGAPASIKLMGFDDQLSGSVESIGRGIADANTGLNGEGLPSVDPTFSWVRLAQRIPVRIKIEHVPANVLLASGMTCSIDVTQSGKDYHSTSQYKLLSWLHTLILI